MSDAQGHAVAIGKTRLSGRPAQGLAAAVPVRLKPGSYKVSWRASSSDGHETQGSFAFRVQR